MLHTFVSLLGIINVKLVNCQSDGEITSGESSYFKFPIYFYLYVHQEDSNFRLSRATRDQVLSPTKNNRPPRNEHGHTISKRYVFATAPASSAAHDMSSRVARNIVNRHLGQKDSDRVGVTETERKRERERERERE